MYVHQRRAFFFFTVLYIHSNINTHVSIDFMCYIRIAILTVYESFLLKKKTSSHIIIEINLISLFWATPRDLCDLSSPIRN